MQARTVQPETDRSRIMSLGALVRSESGDAIPVLAPFTGQPLGHIPQCTAADVRNAVRRAQEAWPGWAGRSFAERKSMMLRFHDALLSHREEGLDLIQLESGKARRYALEEIVDTALVARHYAIHAARYLRTRRHRGAIPAMTTAWEYRHPVGVVGFIAPWNFPLILSITDLIAALMAGNAVVLRPDVQSSFTALWAVDLLRRSGVPADVLQVVTGPGHILGPVLTGLVDFVMFTGSTATGKTVARQASERLIGYSLELGGKNSLLMLDDADMDKTVAGLIQGAFTGAGQVCVSIERAWIPGDLFAEFCHRLVPRVQRMKLSSELLYGPDMGSLTVPSQLVSVQAHVQDALDKGGRILTGGRPRPDIGPLFYEPTVLVGVTPAMKVYAEETFGPVVSLYPYKSLDEAIEGVNDTSYGLNASVWSRSTRRARDVAKRIKAGTVNVNESYAAAWTATASPIGGMRESGFGRRHGAEGILKYTEGQTVAAHWGIPFAAPARIPETVWEDLVIRLLRWIRRIPGLR